MYFNTMDIELNDFAKKQLLACEDFLMKVEDETLRGKLKATMDGSLDTIRRLGKGASLGYDFAPLSFSFSAGGFQGGLIFHGLGENFSIHIDSSFVGWSLHT